MIRMIHTRKIIHLCRLFLTAITSLSLTCCAAQKTHLLQLYFKPSTQVKPSCAISVGLSPFEDKRSSPQVLGRRLLSSGEEEPILLNSSSPRSDVTRILRRMLESRGCKVIPMDSWKPEPQSLHEIPPEISVAITGNIDVLQVEAHSSLWRTEVQYHVRLTGYVGLRGKKEVLKRSIEVNPQESHLRFNLRTVEENLNAAVEKALNLLWEGIQPSSP